MDAKLRLLRAHGFGRQCVLIISITRVGLFLVWMHRLLGGMSGCPVVTVHSVFLLPDYVMKLIIFILIFKYLEIFICIFDQIIL